jgi:hypothetical protein
MKMKLSEQLVDFFLDVEIVSISEHDSTDYYYEQLLFETNEYNLRSFIKFQKRFIKDSFYEEISSLLDSTGHAVDNEILKGAIVLFCLSSKELRTASLVTLFFPLLKSVN